MWSLAHLKGHQVEVPTKSLSLSLLSAWQTLGLATGSLLDLRDRGTPADRTCQRQERLPKVYPGNPQNENGPEAVGTRTRVSPSQLALLPSAGALVNIPGRDRTGLAAYLSIPAPSPMQIPPAVVWPRLHSRKGEGMPSCPISWLD